MKSSVRPQNRLWKFFAARLDTMLALAANPHRIKAAHRRRRRLTSSERFPGQYFDRETGLNYNSFRDYEAGTGRYVESDPIGLAGGLNTYSYVDSNPIDNIDIIGWSRGKRSLSTEGFTKRSSAADVLKKLREALKDPRKNAARIKSLRALLKVIKRGGSMMLIFDPSDIFKRQCEQGDYLACISYCKLNPEDEGCKPTMACYERPSDRG